VTPASADAAVARSGRPSTFDTRSVHTFELIIRRREMQAVLDGFPVSFLHANKEVTTLNIQKTIGEDHGAVGVAFSAEDNRGTIGGQRVTKLVISNYSSFGALPVRPLGAM
jgi:hypothetical protein